MSRFPVLLALVMVTGACRNVAEGDDGSDTNPRPGDTGGPSNNQDTDNGESTGPACKPSRSVDAYMQEGQYWQAADNGALCWNDHFQEYEPESWGCLNPGHVSREKAAESLPVAGQQALDCACAFYLSGGQEVNGYTGICDVAVATYLDFCGSAPEGVTTVEYSGTNGARCIYF